MIGADLSEEMLAEAEQKARDLPEDIRPFFICQPMQRLRLAEPVDAVICALDSLNYLTRPDDCRKTFRRVYDALKPGGLFVFDINTPAKLRGLDGQVFLDETDDTYCVWRTEFDAKKRLCYYGMDIFRLDGDALGRVRLKSISNMPTSRTSLRSWLQEAGFTHIRQYGDRVLRAPKQDEQRIYFSAREGLTMKDELVRAMTKDGFVNAVAVTTTGIVERARQIHKTLPTATAALGRLLTRCVHDGQHAEGRRRLHHAPAQGQRAAGPAAGRIGCRRQRARLG